MILTVHQLSQRRRRRVSQIVFDFAAIAIAPSVLQSRCAVIMIEVVVAWAIPVA